MKQLVNALYPCQLRPQPPRVGLRHVVRLWLAFVLCTASWMVSARVVTDLYQVNVAIDAQSPAELRRASREGLAELFVRISGHESVLGNDAIVAAIKDASRFTKQFSYERTVDEVGEEQLLVTLEFESSLVVDTLRGAGMPLWSDNRPSVLVWLVVEDADGRRFVGTEKDPQLVAAIRASAERRGLAIQLPFLDLQDLVALSPDDIWQRNQSRLDEAAERYASDSLLTGRVTKLNNGSWLGRWTFSLNGRQIRFDGDADDAVSYIAAGLNQVAEALASEYAITPVATAEGGVLMRLTAVRSFVDYARAISYLESVVAIHHANVVSLQGDELILSLVADGEMSQLQQVFSLDKRLQPELENVYTGPYPVVASYRWPSTAPPLPDIEPVPTDSSLEADDSVESVSLEDMNANE